MCSDQGTCPDDHEYAPAVGDQPDAALPHSGVCCSIIPPHILEHIANNTSVPSAARTYARESLRNYNSLIQRQITDSAKFRARKKRSTGSIGRRLIRWIYSSDYKPVHGTRPLRYEGAPPGTDLSADELYDSFGKTFDFFYTIFKRNSIDDNGMIMTGSVHYGDKGSDVFWHFDRMVAGDGDGIIWNRPTAILDVIAHEITHGITQHTAGLLYQGESGALNESMSDVFGIMAKQYYLNQTAAQSDWLIGAGFYKANFATALRSMKAPGTAYNHPWIGRDLQSSHYSQVLANPYPLGGQDHGGVHIHSGVPNRAFYLVAIGLGGYSWDRAGRIWYAVLTGGRLQSNANFLAFANLAIWTAEYMYGKSVAAVVEQAWRDVGVWSGSQQLSPMKIDGGWSGTKSRGRIECTFNVTGTKLEGNGVTHTNGKRNPFQIKNGTFDQTGNVHFTIKFHDSGTSSENYRGKFSRSDDTISGKWENVERKDYLRAGHADSDILSGSFKLTRKS